MLAKFSALALRLLRWHPVGTPAPDARAVLIAAPHTSNWDFLYFILTAWSLKLPIRWAAKDSAFVPLIGRLMKAIGGIPINREAPGGTVDQLANIFAEGEPIVLLIAPEGTRSQRPYWKSGFYRVAQQANVPVAFGFMDYAKKEVGMKPGFLLTGDVKADMDRIREFYKNITAKHPDEFGPVLLRSEKSS